MTVARSCDNASVKQCLECGATITAPKHHKYCSATCLTAVRNRQPRLYRRPTGICAWCGEAFVYSGGHNQSCCSFRCRGMASRTVLVSIVPWVQCDQCQRWFVGRRKAKRCSPECRKLANRAATDRWTDSAANSERIMRLYRLACSELDVPKASMWRHTLTDHLARRDGDRCAICHQRIDLTLPSGPKGDPMGPSIDHVIPVSHGGEDTMQNIRLTHWSCNNKRGNRGGNEQLRLIA